MLGWTGTCSRLTSEIFLCSTEKMFYLRQKIVHCAGGSVCAWYVWSWDFSTSMTRRAALCLPDSVSCWDQRQNEMLSGFLLHFSPLLFSKDLDRWNNPPAPCPATGQPICLNYRLQQLLVLFKIFQIEANNLHSEWRWHKKQWNHISHPSGGRREIYGVSVMCTCCIC